MEIDRKLLDDRTEAKSRLARDETPAAETHHCPGHSHFTASCESCRRAHAAFLPYRNADPNPSPASRSFGSTGQMSPAYIAALTETLPHRLARVAASEAVADATSDVIDALFD